MKISEMIPHTIASTLRRAGTRLAFVVFASLLTLSACKEDPIVEQTAYGYVQFNVVTSSTRAVGTQLDSLSEAAVVRVLLSHEGTTF